MKILFLILGFSLFAQVRYDYKSSIDAIKENNQVAFEKSICGISDIDSLVVEETGRVYSLLGYACMYRREGIVAFLLNKGADMHKGYSDDIYELDALYIAINSADARIVHCLIKKGVDVNAIYNEDGLTSLVVVCQTNNADIVKMLIDNGTNVDGAGDCGGDYILYPLIVSVENSSSTVVELLLASGANRKIQTKQELTFNDAVNNCKDEKVRSVVKSWIEKEK